MCSLRFCFRTRDGWYPLFALVGRCVRFWKRKRGVSPRWMVSPAFGAACARLHAALAEMIERLFARSILCEKR